MSHFPTPQHTHGSVSNSRCPGQSSSPNVSLSHPGLPFSPLTCKTFYAQGDLSISQKASSTWSLYKDPRPAPSRSSPSDSPAEIPGGLRIQWLHCTWVSHLAAWWVSLCPYSPVLNLEVILDRDCTEYVTVWMVWPKMYYKLLGSTFIATLPGVWQWGLLKHYRAKFAKCTHPSKFPPLSIPPKAGDTVNPSIFMAIPPQQRFRGVSAFPT